MLARFHLPFRQALALALALVLATVGLLVSPIALGPAAAHSYLNSSNPSDGAELTSAPSRVVLKFSDDVRDTGLGVTAKGPDGPMTLDSVARDKQITSAWPPTTPAGSYQVNYRVVSVDGHVMSGQISFTIAGGAAAADSSVPEDQTTTGKSDDTGAVPPGSPTESTATQQADAGATGQQSPGSVPVLLLALGVLVTVVGTGVFAFIRQRRQQ